MDKPRFTVLVVDDEPSLRRLILRALKRNGIEPIGAANGAEGLEVFEANRDRIDLVILDMLMPVMSGLDLAAELERRRPGVKILYVSGNGASIAMESIIRQSADRVLLKPFKERALMERVSHLLGMGDIEGEHTAPHLTRESA